MNINYVIATHFVYTLVIDYLPSSVTVLVSALLPLMYVGCAISGWRRSKNNIDFYVSVFFVFGIICCWLLASVRWEPYISYSPPSYKDFFRQLAPYVSFMAIVYARKQLSKIVIILCVLLVILSSAYHAILFPQQFLNFTLRYASFASDLHTSGYILAGCILLLYELKRKGEIGFCLFLFFNMALIILLLGNGVRTPIVFIMVYGAVEVIYRLSKSELSMLIRLVGCFTLVCLALITILIMVDVDVNVFSSGRLGNYIERYHVLANRDLLTLLIGSGPGTDRIITLIWWWDVKDSHSDIIKFLWESGVVGVFFFIGFTVNFLKAYGKVAYPFFCGLIATSLISNAIMSRPNAAFLFFIVLALKLEAVNNQR